MELFRNCEIAVCELFINLVLHQGNQNSMHCVYYINFMICILHNSVFPEKVCQGVMQYTESLPQLFNILFHYPSVS